MPRVHKPKSQRALYSLDDLKSAVEYVRRGKTLLAAHEKYKIPVSTISKYRKQNSASIKSIGAGRKTKLTSEDEQTIVTYLLETSRNGYGLTKTEVLQFVKEYCEYSCMDWNENGDGKGPGQDWFYYFMKRHPNLALRKGETMSSMRVKAADPFTIYQWYESLEKVFKEENIGPADGYRVYNCDETSFGHDPKEVKIVAKKGQKRVSKNVAGSGKKSTTVLACENAAGEKLPPLIIFQGKYVWKNWLPDENKEYPGTNYTAQKNGWMDADIFCRWFQEQFLDFVGTLEERKGKRIVLIFDGAAMHSNYKLAKLAVDNGVVLIKLPPNSTHNMQPLDKCVFKAIKRHWNILLLEYNRNFPGKLLPNDEFSMLIKKIWEISFKGANMLSGFRSTGLFPIDFKRFPETDIDIEKLKRFRMVSSKSHAGSDSLVSSNSTCASVSGAEVANNLSSCSTLESFIRFKLNENFKKKSSEAKVRKRITDQVGSILTTKKALQILKDKEEASTSQKKCYSKEKVNKQCEKRKLSTDSEDEPLIKLVKKRNLKSKINYESDTDTTISDEEILLESEFEVESEYGENENEQTVNDRAKIRLGDFYAVFYDNNWYLGQIIEIVDKNFSKIKFLKPHQNTFIWPKKAQTEKVSHEFIFFGPVNIKGSDPFTIPRHDLVTINKQYEDIKNG